MVFQGERRGIVKIHSKPPVSSIFTDSAAVLFLFLRKSRFWLHVDIVMSSSLKLCHILGHELGELIMNYFGVNTKISSAGPTFPKIGPSHFL